MNCIIRVTRGFNYTSRDQYISSMNFSTGSINTEDKEEYKPKFYRDLKDSVVKLGMDYDEFISWKCGNNKDYPISYNGYLFEKLDLE